MGKGLLSNINMDQIWRSECGTYTVTISRDCLNKIIEIVTKFHPKEIGTSLVGSYSDDGFDAFVLDITPISSDSISSRYTFRRGIKGLHQFFKNLKKRFQGKRFYVGEWHSHPNSAPFPSNQDDKTQFEISKDPKTNCSESILIIVGGSPSELLVFSVFVYSKTGKRINLILIS